AGAPFLRLAGAAARWADRALQHLASAGDGVVARTFRRGSAWNRAVSRAERGAVLRCACIAGVAAAADGMAGTGSRDGDGRAAAGGSLSGARLEGRAVRERGGRDIRGADTCGGALEPAAAARLASGCHVRACGACGAGAPER